MAQLMEERAINDDGKDALTPTLATSNQMPAEFGRQLEPVARRPAPVYEATHSVLQHKLGGDHIRYMVDDDQCSKILNVKFLQVHTRTARLHVQSINRHEISDSHVVASQFVHMIPHMKKQK